VSALRTRVEKLVDAGVDAKLRVIHGLNREPADLIAEAAKESAADVIVVGTRGHGRLAGMVLGSVAQRLLHVAPCPVLAVPPNVDVPSALVAT
jgi:nucleotide-binding universal stress UspA family protein